MINIDYIMYLLDWNKSISEQEKGMKLAKDIESINVFIQPCNKNYNKNVWSNCAIILSQRTDDELSPYLIELMKWLQDSNWPGFDCIFNRLLLYVDNTSFEYAYNICLNYAKALDDKIWENNLRRMKTKKEENRY